MAIALGVENSVGKVWYALMGSVTDLEDNPLVSAQDGIFVHL